MSPALTGLLLSLAPVLALIVLLLLRRYPGERVIERLRRLIDLVTGPGRTGKSGGVRPAPRTRSRRRLPLADSLAGRGPPVPA